MAEMTKAYDPNITVLVGGVQATTYPDSFFVDSIDYVFKSTTRKNIKTLIDNVENGNKAVLMNGVYSRNLNFKNDSEFCFDEYIVPDRQSTLDIEKNIVMWDTNLVVLQTAYGCRNRCKFV